MTIAVADLFSRVDDLLLDPDKVRWPAAERIRWANEAMGAILIRRPAAFPVNELHTLQAGTKQTIPAGGAQLLDVVRNIGADGLTPGRAIRRTDRQLLDDSDPDWHNRKAREVIEHFTFDDRDPKSFYVYPPAVADLKVELVHAKLPAPVAEADLDGAFAIGGEYLEATVNYMCYRAHLKDSEFSVSPMAAAFYQAFEAGLGLQTQVQHANSPNLPETSV